MRLKPQRLKLYTTLRREHLTYREALEFSKMRKHVPPTGGKAKYPPALTAIVRERRVMWRKFEKEAVPAGWGGTKVSMEWKKRGLNGWVLYDAKYDELPEDQRWDTPRSWRTALGTKTSFRAVSRYRVRELKKDAQFFESEIKRTGDPDGALKWKLDGVRYQLKTGEY